MALQCGTSTMAEVVTVVNKNETAIATKAQIDDATPSGQVAFFAGVIAPTGWLECPDFAAADSAYPLKTAYPDLYAYIQDTWGTLTDTTRFKIPNSSKDSKGYFLRGVGGETVGTKEEDVLKEHLHLFSSSFSDIGGSADAGGTRINPNRLIIARGSDSVYENDTPDAIKNEGDSLETRPMAQTMLMCIKT